MLFDHHSNTSLITRSIIMKPSVILSLLVFGALILATKPSVLPLEAQENNDDLEHPTDGIEPEAAQIHVREKRFLPFLPLLPWLLSINMTEMAILRAQKFAKEKFIENWQTQLYLDSLKNRTKEETGSLHREERSLDITWPMLFLGDAVGEISPAESH